MSIGSLSDNNMMSLALQGYNPFQPDMGILCGGYQGPLYPQPTTLSYPGFDPYLYTDPIASTYTMDKGYTGLNIGDPGIDYKNPGHILGLLDTFSRMEMLNPLSVLLVLLFPCLKMEQLISVMPIYIHLYAKYQVIGLMGFRYLLILEKSLLILDRWFHLA